MYFHNFLKQYLKNPRTVGAIAPSSKKLADKMLEDIRFLDASCIVEYGPGTGVFTEKILKKKSEGTIFIAIEYNESFYKILNEKYKDHSNFILINGSAENISEYLLKYGIQKVDFIVSGLPFSSLPEDISHRILADTKNVLVEQGEFITFQYTLFKIKLFQSYFGNIKKKKVFLNLPPANVLKCKNH